MNTRLIHEAVDAYTKDASASDAARLNFFEGLYDLIEQRAQELPAYNSAAKAAELETWYWGVQSVTTAAGLVIAPDAFAQTCEALAAYFVEHAGLEEAAADELAALDWQAISAKLDLSLAAANPPQFIEQTLTSVDDLGISSTLPANIFVMVVFYALRAHLEPLQKAVDLVVDPESRRLKTNASLTCPVCGSAPSASCVGQIPGAEGRVRTQYCAQCGQVWAFERLRCGHCGTTNASHLHYFNVEGDEAHRLHSCDECGRYERVVFREDLQVPFVYEVEDVVMAKLDRIALDPRFRKDVK